MSSHHGQTQNGEKITADKDHPIDNVLNGLADQLSPYFYELKYTPNGITTLSSIFAIASTYHLYNRDIGQFSIYLLISYFFDVMDGFYARKYKMTSKFGDMYDHIKDFVQMILCAYIVYAKYNITNYPVVVLIILVFTVLSMMHYNCVENLRKDERSDATKIFEVLSPDKKHCKKYIKYYRWVGIPTYMIVFMISVWYIDYNQSIGKL
jgi:phosphatidylglycerophosphate synthase